MWTQYSPRTFTTIDSAFYSPPRSWFVSKPTRHHVSGSRRSSFSLSKSHSALVVSPEFKKDFSERWKWSWLQMALSRAERRGVSKQMVERRADGCSVYSSRQETCCSTTPSESLQLPNIQITLTRRRKQDVDPAPDKSSHSHGKPGVSSLSRPGKWNHNVSFIIVSRDTDKSAAAMWAMHLMQLG